MRFQETIQYQKTIRNTENELELLDNIASSLSYGEFIIKCELAGIDVNHFDRNRFYVLLGYALDDQYQTYLVKKHDYNALLDILVEHALNTTGFDYIFREKMFWNMCGRWIRHNYNSKDKTRYIKLCVILGKAATSQLKIKQFTNFQNVI